jgi:nickel-dependent lactate racemase
LAYEADLLVSEGFIEPHFFAGFSGGRKSVLPGIAGRETVLANHCSHFIAHPRARTGVLEGNPIHEDMIWAAQAAKLRFIVNVVLNGSKETIYAVAGDPLEAHKKGTEFLSSLCTVAPAPADIVISTNGGFPLDQNMYQAVKGMTAAEASLKPGGVMIMIAASADGIGGEHFYRQIAEAQSLQERMDEFLSRSAEETHPDQWQSQIFIRILLQFPVIYLSQLEDQTVSDMHMIPAHSLEEALQKARELVSHQASITVIPDGVSVIVKQ